MIDTNVDPATQPYTLKAIFESVIEDLTTQLKTQGAKIPKTGYGAKKLARTEAPPRIVCVPRDGVSDGQLTRKGDGTRNSPWPLWGRSVTCQFHVWGEDEDAAELLCWHLVASLHSKRAGLYTMRSEHWDESTDTNFGQLVILTADIYTIWSREFIPAVQGTPEQSATITPPS